MDDLRGFLYAVDQLCPVMTGERMLSYFDTFTRSLAASLEINLETTHPQMEELEFRVVNQLLGYAYDHWKIIHVADLLNEGFVHFDLDNYFSIVNSCYEQWESVMAEYMTGRVIRSQRLTLNQHERSQLHDTIETEIEEILRPNRLMSTWHNCYSCHRKFLREDCNGVCEVCHGYLVVETTPDEEAVDGQPADFMFAPDQAVPYEEAKMRALAGNLSCLIQVNKFPTIENDEVPLEANCGGCGQREGHEIWKRISCCEAFFGRECLIAHFSSDFICPYCDHPIQPDSTVGNRGDLNSIAAGVLFVSRGYRHDPELMP